MMHPYLIRVRERSLTLTLKRQIVFGLVGGWLLLAYGSFRLFYVIKARPLTAHGLIWTGAVLFLLALIYPRALAPVEAGVRRATSHIGKAIFALVLSLAYFLVITPVGVVWRKVRGLQPFFAWKGPAPAHLEGWIAKELVDDDRDVSEGATRRLLVTQPFVIVGYFIRHGHFILLPIVMVLLLFGLVLFFVKSSALAPFIYTLF